MAFDVILAEMHTLLDPLATQPCRHGGGEDCGACATCLARKALRNLDSRLGAGD